MNVFALLIPMFRWIVFISPIAASVIVLILLLRKGLGSKLDPKMFYAVWIILIARMLIPWFPETGVSVWEIVPGMHYETERMEASLSGSLHAAGEDAVLQHETHGGLAVHSTIGWMEISSSTVAYVIWLTGLIMVLLYFVIMFWKWNRNIASQSAVVSDPQLLSSFSACKARMGVKSRIPVLATSLVNTPATFGFWRPKVLIPVHMINKLDHKEWECIFIHEFIHIRRKDYLWNMFMVLMTALHWFNPFMWVAFAKMREDQEVSCDAKTVKYVNKVQYGQTLIKVLELASIMNQRAVLPFISGKKKRVQRRIEMVLSKKKTMFTVAAVVLIALIAIMVNGNPGIGAKAEAPESGLAFVMPAEGQSSVNGKGGLDILNESGTPVYAAESGTIQQAGYAKADGNLIVIAHDDGYESTYAHLQEIFVEAGQTVEKGQVIGTIGSTGRSTGPHLAFAVLKDGQPVDPTEIFDASN